MNAPRSFIRATMAPASLAAAIGMAFAMSAPAQAQYRYPGPAGSSGHYANSIHPIRTGYAHAPARRGSGNPGMQRGEACPPGSNCALHGPDQQSNGGGPAPSGAYGAPGGYGYATSPSSAHEAAAPASRNASISPVRARSGRSAMNYGPSRTSNANFYNSVTGKTNGPTTNPTGQPTSFNGPNGKVGMGGPQSFTGPNGKSQTIGGGPDLNNIGGGYGHQKGSAIKQGMSYSVDANGSMSGTRTGSAPGMANGGVDSYKASNGAGGANETWSEDNQKYNPFSGNGTTTSDYGKLTWKDGKKWNGTDSDGQTWVNGKQGKLGGFNNGGGSHQSSEAKAEGEGLHRLLNTNLDITKQPDNSGGGSTDSADMGPTSGPGEVVSGTGQVVHPGKPGGQDTGGGQGKDAGGSGSGDSKNATGQYATSNTPLSGQDAPIKPKEQGVLKMNYNGKNGVTDPKLSGSNGGGG